MPKTIFDSPEGISEAVSNIVLGITSHFDYF